MARRVVLAALMTAFVLAPSLSSARPAHPLQCDESSFARTCHLPAEAFGVVPHCSCKVLSRAASTARQAGACIGTCSTQLMSCNKAAFRLCINETCDGDGFVAQSEAYDQCRANYDDCSANCLDPNDVR